MGRTKGRLMDLTLARKGELGTRTASHKTTASAGMSLEPNNIQELMKVFLSSLITGVEPLRAAAREALTTLRHQPVMAEDFGAQPATPQVACLSGIRQSDLVVLILGEHYGAIQPSGLSATHEEYREAKGRKPVIAFVQEGVKRDARESEFVDEVQGWEGGLFRGGFTTAEDLRVAVTRALYDYSMANAVGPVNSEELVTRAQSLLPTDRRSNSSGEVSLSLVIVGGPYQTILRPVEIENPALADVLLQRALFGEGRLFDRSKGSTQAIEGEDLVIKQARGGTIRLNEQGVVLITVPLLRRSGMMELVQEVVQEQLTSTLGYATWALDHIDPTQRLTHTAIATTVLGADWMGWRTQHESDESPNMISLSRAGSDTRSPVHVSRPRPALRLDSARIVEDLLVPLRRQWK